MYESQDLIGRTDADEFVEFVRTGAEASGEFECTSCGYGAIIRRELPPCPMCGGELWERAQWTPFTTALSGLKSRLSR